LKIERVAVLGGGLMGSGIAESAARAGLPVIVRDVDEAAIAGAGTRVAASLHRAIEGGKLSAEEAEEIRRRIVLTSELGDIADADLVVEAVPENAELKANILRQVAGYVSERALIASNTSSIPIAQLAAGIHRPERVLGLHFFSPVPVMPLVEVVVALDTSAETVRAASEFAARIGKTAIETKGMKLGCGHPMGPLTLADFIGLDVLYSVCDSLYEEFKRSEYAPPPLLKRMVASGRIGRKSGRGFYEYERAAMGSGVADWTSRAVWRAA
jgi:3-hydroxybutyryl-CoA dehydrogenase